MLVHWIWLATRNHVSDRLKVELLRHFQDPENAYFADVDSYAHIEGLTEEGKTALQDKNLAEAEKILRDCQRENLSILTYQDAAYPARLKNISDPPLVLYYKGILPDFDSLPLIGVVPEDPSVLLAAASGIPLLMYTRRGAAAALRRIARRIQGLNTPINL